MKVSLMEVEKVVKERKEPSVVEYFPEEKASLVHSEEGIHEDLV
jgi:hypothetical protein